MIIHGEPREPLNSADKQVFVLAHAQARENAARAVFEAADGMVVTVAPPSRSAPQNDLLWAILHEFARQKTWPVNGRPAKLSEEEWKDVLTASYQGEVRLSPSIDGRSLVLLGARTSRMGKQRMADFLAYVEATAAEFGIKLAAGA